MKYYIIKRDDKSDTPCCYFKEKSTWSGNWKEAEQFEDAVDAEYHRKRMFGNYDDRPGQRKFIVEVELTEKEVVVQSTAVVAKPDGPIPRSGSHISMQTK